MNHDPMEDPENHVDMQAVSTAGHRSAEYRELREDLYGELMVRLYADLREGLEKDLRKAFDELKSLAIYKMEERAEPANLPVELQRLVGLSSDDFPDQEDTARNLLNRINLVKYRLTQQEIIDTDSLKSELLTLAYSTWRLLLQGDHSFKIPVLIEHPGWISKD